MMISSFWKQVCVALPLALTATSGDVAWGQTFRLVSTNAALSNATDEQLFDAQLLSVAPPCINSSQMPNSSSMPMQTPGSQTPGTDPNPYSLSPSPAASTPGALSAGQGALTAQTSVASAAMMAGGYLDPAAPVTMFRMRYDDAINNKFPDRGEYFYAKCGCFRSPALAGALLDPNAKGPQGVHSSVSYQDVRPYLEYALNPKFSVFTELPFRFVNFNSLPIPANTQTNLTNEGGLADMNAGFKYAFIAEQDRYVTFQLRTYIPTGDSYEGLGTGHVSIEPSILFYQRLSQKWLLQGQLTEFTPINVSSFASDVVQYGGGVGYVLAQTQNFTVIPTLEAVGWTFLNGQKFSPVDGGLQSAQGDTIFNIKPGVRVGLGRSPGPMMMQQQSVYAGFGIPVTDQQFYTNLFRVEYRILF